MAGSGVEPLRWDRLLVPRWLKALRDERRALGWKGLLRKRGWRLVAAVIVFYLVRDIILYLLIPAGLMAWLFQ
ncbi:MAG: hypothetical protein Q7J79_08050 [Gemmatimonadales bacterium]|nr:hypothetical protein [Gemmatimonadales bacterium]